MAILREKNMVVLKKGFEPKNKLFQITCVLR